MNGIAKKYDLKISKSDKAPLDCTGRTPSPASDTMITMIAVVRKSMLKQAVSSIFRTKISTFGNIAGATLKCPELLLGNLPFYGISETDLISKLRSSIKTRLPPYCE